MAWLFGPMLASLIASFFVTKILELILGGMTGMFVTVVKPVVFITTWIVVTTQTAMRNFTRVVRRVRSTNAAVVKALTNK